MVTGNSCKALKLRFERIKTVYLYLENQWVKCSKLHNRILSLKNKLETRLDHFSIVTTSVHFLTAYELQKFLIAAK